MRTCYRSRFPMTVLTLGLSLAGPAAAAGTVAAAVSRPLVKGEILNRYISLGGARSFLGKPLTSETPTPNRPGAYNLFQGGSIYWSLATGAWEVHGAIRSNWGSLGYENSGLGFPISNESPLPGGAAFNIFENGLCYYAPGLGAHEVRGAISGAYTRLGRENGRLGFPVGNELGTPDGIGRYSDFQRGHVYWSPTTGAQEIEGAIFAKWGSLGWENSLLGYPVTDEYAVPGGRASNFQGGTITWTPQTGAVVTTGLGPVSQVATGSFTIADLRQAFQYDDNDTFATVTANPDGTFGPAVLTDKAGFAAQLMVDDVVAFDGYSTVPAGVTTFVLVKGVPLSALASAPTRSRLQKAAASLRR